jgi:hypothetical protein
VAAEYHPLAQDLVRWLRTKPGVSDLQPPITPPKPRRSRLPKPPFVGDGPQPDFELHFTYKGQPRLFRYFIEQPDDPQTMLDNMRVHTNGELMVRVPNSYGQLLPNDIYYANRSAASAR